MVENYCKCHLKRQNYDHRHILLCTSYSPCAMINLSQRIYDYKFQSAVITSNEHRMCDVHMRKTHAFTLVTRQFK